MHNSQIELPLMPADSSAPVAENRMLPAGMGSLKVLVACEESQEVTKAFRLLGHEAYSNAMEEYVTLRSKEKDIKIKKLTKINKEIQYALDMNAGSDYQ